MYSENINTIKSDWNESLSKGFIPVVEFSIEPNEHCVDFVSVDLKLEEDAMHFMIPALGKVSCFSGDCKLIGQNEEFITLSMDLSDFSSLDQLLEAISSEANSYIHANGYVLD